MLTSLFSFGFFLPCSFVHLGMTSDDGWVDVLSASSGEGHETGSLRPGSLPPGRSMSVPGEPNLESRATNSRLTDGRSSSCGTQGYPMARGLVGSPEDGPPIIVGPGDRGVSRGAVPGCNSPMMSGFGHGEQFKTRAISHRTRKSSRKPGKSALSIAFDGRGTPRPVHSKRRTQHGRVTSSPGIPDRGRPVPSGPGVSPMT